MHNVLLKKNVDKVKENQMRIALVKLGAYFSPSRRNILQNILNIHRLNIPAMQPLLLNTNLAE